jgi:hypothetical protein
MTTIELDWNLSWFEQAEMDWWEANPTATEAEFEAAFYGE